ncbi:hypothetical protein OIDMADRAFT_34631 [Oidiodendron maius Zn]|uniref:Amino acid permease/ SLC12A domain-containing protein n=1 Tax=Oidiodendron maius (strain Zn) TaxID=913774 RepID=A0A0C3CY95_OIDMZ|nr:hypothetical protein OIDMADRAFT_34631 [Oidiodendron maius Zn]
MIAIPGSIGTRLLIGTGEALAESGPVAIFIAYSIIGFVVFIVLCAIGEIEAWLLLPSGFTGYANRFVDPALRFAMGIHVLVQISYPYTKPTDSSRLGAAILGTSN